MGFFDTYEDTSRSSFVNEDETAELIASATDLPIVSVKSVTTKYGPSFFVTFLLDGEERTKVFKKADEDGGVESRDDLLGQLEEYLKDRSAERPVVYLEKAGRSILVRNAADK